jgi:hypothetical protein
MFFGAATTTIPIVVPPGRKITPSLALSYNSNAGPSPYGYGWDLSLARIQRATKRGARTCGAEHEEYVLTLPSGTIECTFSNGQCKPRVQEAFVKILGTVAWDGSKNRITWDVWDRSGLHYTFGGADTASLNGGTSFTVPARSGDAAYYDQFMARLARPGS